MSEYLQLTKKVISLGKCAWPLKPSQKAVVLHMTATTTHAMSAPPARPMLDVFLQFEGLVETFHDNGLEAKKSIKESHEFVSCQHSSSL